VLALSRQSLFRGLFAFIQIGVAIPLVLLFLGLGIGSNTFMPGYAAVYVDDEAKIYVALPCVDEWRRRAERKIAMARLTKASEAYRLGYKPDAMCRESGAFAPDDRSFTGSLLVKLGFLSPLTHWWDMPYRTEEGIVYPKRGP
jgi:hypothetical protein